MKKKIALLLAVVMIVTLMPMTVFGFAHAGQLDYVTELPTQNPGGTAKPVELANDDHAFGNVAGAVGGIPVYVLERELGIGAQIGLELTDAIWDLAATGDSRVSDRMLIVRTTVAAGTPGKVLLYAVEKINDQYARVTFYAYDADAALPNADALFAANIGGASVPGLEKASAPEGLKVVLPFKIKYAGNPTAPKIRVTETETLNGTSITSAFTSIFIKDTVTYVKDRAGRLYDTIRVFYMKDLADSSDFTLGRISIQEHGGSKDGKKTAPQVINRYDINKDSQFTVIPLHSPLTEIGKLDNTTLNAGYVRRYITLTAPEGYHWDYDRNLHDLVQTGKYNLLVNPTGIFAADPNRPAWLFVDQVRNTHDKKSNELVLDLDFVAVPTNPDFVDNYNASFEIAANMLRLVRDSDYVVTTGDIPVKVTLSDYNSAHIYTEIITVAKYAPGVNITLSTPGSVDVIGGAYPFIDNSSSVQSAEPGKALGTVTWKEGYKNQAKDVLGHEPNPLTFTYSGATLVGAKVSYVKDDESPVKFASDSRDYIPAGRVAYRQSWPGGAYTSNDDVTVEVTNDNKIIIRKLAEAVDGVLAISITPYFVASVDTESKDITLLVTPEISVPTGVTVGKAVVPATVEVATPAKGSLGKDVKGGELVITETRAGVINGSDYQPLSVSPVTTSGKIATKELTVTLQNDVFGRAQFMENSNVASFINVEPSDAGLSVNRAYVDVAGVLHVVFAGQSSTPVTVTIKDLPFATNRFTYNGSYSVEVGGSAIAANYNNGGLISGLNDILTAKDFIIISDSNVGTGSVDTIDGKALIAQIIVDKDLSGETMGSVVDAVTGVETELDPSPIITNGRTYMPLKNVSILLGIPEENVTWDAATNTAMVDDGEGRAVYFTKNSDTYTVYNAGVITSFKMDGAAFNKNGAMFIPVRYLVNGLFDGTAQENADSTPNSRIIDVYDGR